MKTVFVIGATGQQGGSVARFLSQTGKYIVVCGTRNPTSDAASQLATLANSKVVTCNLDDVKNLVECFTGCDYVFAVTNFWGPYEAELTHGRNIFSAAKDAEVAHVVFSSLESSKELSGGSISGALHFDTKGILEKELAATGLGFTNLRTAFYYENFISFFPPREGKIAMPMADKKLFFYAVEDTGGVVAGILDNLSAYSGKTLEIAGDSIPIAEVAQILSNVVGKKYEYVAIPAEAFATFGFPGAEDLADMFRWFCHPKFHRDVELTKKLYPGVKAFKKWAEENKDKF